jgi:hypothetical protein
MFDAAEQAVAEADPDDTNTKPQRKTTQMKIPVGELPSRENLSGRLDAITARFDKIAAKCEREGATALSISALDKLRLTIESLARIAGHSGGGSGTTVNVGVNVAMNAGDIGASIARHLAATSLPPAQVIEAVGLLDE